MEKVTRHIPNFLTSCNLASGSIGTVLAFEGYWLWAAAMIWVGALFDFFDGFAARMLKQYSPIGGELDSLADLVTFGFLPSTIMYVLLKETGSPVYVPFFAYLLVIFSALRLAKFNIDERQATSFYGLPTPASALFVSALPFVLRDAYAGACWLQNPWILLSVVAILSLLMVSDMPLFSLKFKSFSWRGNRIRYIFLILSVLLIVGLKFLSIPIIIILYVFLSLLTNKPDKIT